MSNTTYTSETIARRVREALGEFNDDDEAITVLVSRLAAEVRRLRREANDVFECADGTVAKDASVSAQSWADECRRLREREARARELATITVDTLDDLQVDALRDEWSRWLGTE